MNVDSKTRRLDSPHVRGNALFLATAVVTVAIGLTYSTIFVSVAEVKRSQVQASRTRAFYAAEAGLELAVNELKDITRKAGLTEPFASLDKLFTSASSQPAYTRLYVDHDLLQDGKMFGTVNVQLSLAGQDENYRDITVTVDAYVPGRYVTRNGERQERHRATMRLEKTVRVALKAGSVFDYSYFINNWGWFYADSITANGNARSNGQFDAGNYRPVINGTPRYAAVQVTRDPGTGAVTANLLGYMDDNDDGVTDGTDGGVYSGWNIVGSDNVRGMASDPKNRHEFVDTVPMPNLNDLTLYEKLARERLVNGNPVPSSVQVGTTVVSGPVFGDDAGETGNLYLHGTDENPIVLDGPVVVRGNLILSGKVKGQGSFYVGGNVYIPDDISYVNPPTTWLPANNSKSETEAWISANYDKDLMGLFAKENVVIGDFTNADWRNHVGSWLSHSLNQSKEDAGSDQIPNTRYGRDGLPNTPDDDILEGDNEWTVERYTQADADAGRIPAGKNVNDPIPGTGEDIDADGVYDDTINLGDFDLPAALTSENWGGNLPAGGLASYSDVGRMDVSQLDCVLYTNHALAFRSQAEVTFNGAMISRNEAIIYGYHFTINHDRRLLGGGANPQVILPKVFGEIEDLNYVQHDILDLSGGTSVPVVPPVSVRLELDPEHGGDTGKVVQQITLPGEN